MYSILIIKVYTVHNQCNCCGGAKGEAELAPEILAGLGIDFISGGGSEYANIEIFKSSKMEEEYIIHSVCNNIKIFLFSNDYKYIK